MATGFDVGGAAPEAEEPVRRSVPLDTAGGFGSPHYKGEMNLKDLDTPAYERRSRVAPPAEKTREVEETADEAPLANVRRLRTSELPAQPGERIQKGDPDVPAFLRRMMD
jgi:cell division protein FtsZ